MRDHSPKQRTAPDTEASTSSAHPSAAIDGAEVGLDEASQPHPTPHAWNARLIFRLRAAAQGCNFHEIARRTNAHAETVRRYFRDGNPSVSFVARFCTVFNVSADWLLTGKHWSRKRRAGSRSALPDGKLNLTLALSKGRVRVLNQGQNNSALTVPFVPSRPAPTRNGGGAKPHAAGTLRGRAGAVAGSAGAQRPHS